MDSIRPTMGNCMRHECAYKIFGSEIASAIATVKSCTGNVLLNNHLGLVQNEDLEDKNLVYPDIFPFLLGPGDKPQVWRVFLNPPLMTVSLSLISNVQVEFLIISRF